MEFSGNYLAYEEYRGLGGTIDLMPFNVLEFDARRKIDEKTQNRLKNLDKSEIPFEVKMCIYKMINSMSTYDEKLEKASKGVASENIDGYSVSYITGSQIQEVIKAKNQELDDIISTNLYGVIVNGEHILYIGAN